MVSATYLERKPAGPSSFKRFFDQRVVPLAIDAAACIDIGVVNANRQIRRNPMLGLGLALGIGALVAAASSTRRRR